MNKCNHDYWSPYPDLRLCSLCGDSLSLSKVFGISELVSHLNDIRDGNMIINLPSKPRKRIKSRWWL